MVEPSEESEAIKMLRKDVDQIQKLMQDKEPHVTAPPEDETREDAWRDRLTADELAVADRLGGMSTSMGIAWVGVEVNKAHKDITEMKTNTVSALRDAPLATAKAIAEALKAANPANGDTKKGLTISPNVLAGAATFGAFMAGLFYALIRLLGGV